MSRCKYCGALIDWINQSLLSTIHESLADGLIDRDEYQDLKGRNLFYVYI